MSSRIFTGLLPAHLHDGRRQLQGFRRCQQHTPDRALVLGAELGASVRNADHGVAGGTVMAYGDGAVVGGSLPELEGR